MLTILDPGEESELGDDAEYLPDMQVTFPVFVNTAPSFGTTVDMQVSRIGVSEVFELAYHAMGSEEIENIIMQLRHPKAPSEAPSEELARTRALALAENLRGPFQEMVRDTLQLIDETAKEVFEEQLDSARINCGISRCGLVNEEMAYPVVAWDKARQTVYRDFRNQVAAVAIATRNYEGEQRRAALDGAEQIMRRVPEWARVYNPASPPVGAVELRRRKLLAVWSAAVAKFPIIAVASADFVAAAVEVAQDDNAAPDADFGDRFNQDRLLKLCKEVENEEFGNPLDSKLRRLCGEWHRNIRKAGAELRKEFGEASAWVWGAKTTQYGIIPAGAGDAGRFLAEGQPLWRFPLIIAEALQRIGAGPGSLAYSAASHSLEMAADIAEKERESAETDREILALASMSFGAMALLPVVGQAAGLAASACALVIAVPNILKYHEDAKQYAAFGPYAIQHHLAAPDGMGLVIDSLDAASAALPVLGVAGRMAGRLIRLTAMRATSFGGKRILLMGLQAQARSVGAVYNALDVAINAVAADVALNLNKAQRP